VGRASAKFDRKGRYIYPDLAQKPRVSQFRSAHRRKTAGSRWKWAEKEKDTYLKTIGIRAVCTMEEDAGKLVAWRIDRLAGQHPFAWIYNRARCALAEDVSKPDLPRGPEAAKVRLRIRGFSCVYLRASADGQTVQEGIPALRG